MRNEGEPLSPRGRGWTIVVLAVAVAAWVVVAGVVHTASLLRPIADDYCHAAVGLEGYLASLGIWYLTWIGDLFQVSVTGLLVGQTIVHVPLTVASLIPFLLSGASVSAVAIVGARLSSTVPRRSRVLAVALASPIAMLAWWGSWWLPAIVDPNPVGISAQLASSVTHWQVVNVQYTLVPAVLMIAWVLIQFRSWPHAWIRPAALGLLGFLAGTGGLVFGVAAVTFAGVTPLVQLALTGQVSRGRIRDHAVFIATGLAGLVVALLSPGVANRAIELQPGLPAGPSSPLGMFGWIFPTAILQWVDAFVTVGVLSVVLIAAGTAVLLSRIGVGLAARPLVGAAGSFAMFALIVAIAARAGEAFSYVAHWHEVTTRTVVFVAAALMGLALGTRLAAAGRTIAVPTILASGVVALAVLGSLVVMRADVVQRLEAWERGPAPTISTADIETEWVRGCWVTMKDEIPLPDRD